MEMRDMGDAGVQFNPQKCVKCRTCELVCKEVHDLEPGIWPIVIQEVWKGAYPDISREFYPLVCRHCEDPACVRECPTGAIAKREEDGGVVVDRELCVGCGICRDACPYHVPQFDSRGVMHKCDLCVGRENGPACVQHCPANALSMPVHA
jgi:Fe-S-cluster-containing dehydrogenase component